MEELKQLRVSDNYLIRSFDKQSDSVYVASLDDITNYIVENGGKNYNFILHNTCDLKDVLFDLVNNQKVIPQIKFSGRKIICLSVKLDNHTYTISRSADNSVPEDNDHDVQEEEHAEYLEQDKIFYQAIMKESLMSKYPDDVREIEHYYLLDRPQAT